MKKKLLLSAILICIGILAFGIINASAETYGDLTYEIIDGEIKITGHGYDVIETGEIVIPSEINGYPVTTIGSGSIMGTYVKKVVFPESITTIESFALNGCINLTSITVPCNVAFIGESPFDGEKLTTINVDENNMYYSSLDGVLFNKDKTRLIQYPDAKEKTNYVIPDSVNYIENYAFSHCVKLKSVTIPNGIVSIGSFAFYHCTGLTNISIPDSVTYMGKEAFAWCTGLTSITIPQNVTSIESSTFYCCFNLKSIILPKNLISIGGLAFAWCENLLNITIPYRVKSIGIAAFSQAGNLTIYYPGTEEDWNKIIIGEYNDDLLSAKKVYNFETGVEIIEATSTENSLKFVSKASINPNDEISSFGTTFIPLWLFELGATNTSIVIYDNATHNIKNGQTFGATLSGIQSLFKDMAIVGKSFIKDSSGNYIWSDAKYASVSNTTLKDVE